MELHQLRYFVAVAEQRHFTKAAHELAVAQPSVSKQIRRLEDELGAPLFHRMRGNVALTPAGEALLPLARRVLTDVEGAESEVRDLTGMRRGRLSVGATPSLSTTLIPQALARYLVGGYLDSFHGKSLRFRLWSWANQLNARHSRWAWFSLFSVMLTDLYIRLCAMGVITDLRWVS